MHQITNSKSLKYFSYKVIMSLEKEFQRIRDNHKSAIQARAARVVMGPSVARVFAKNTKDFVYEYLNKMDLSSLQNIKSQSEYKIWFEDKLKCLAKVIKKNNPISKKPKIYPGYKWGHSTKVHCLFLNDVIIHRDFFDTKTANRLVYFLYLPIDSIVIKRLKKIGVKLDFVRIKEIDTDDKFYSVQDILKKSAKQASIPSIWFDDNWGDRQ